MAQPALLYMFKKEIKLQSVTDNEKKQLTNRLLLDSMHANQKAAFSNQQQNLQKQLNEKYAAVAAARENFLSETDGSGGTGKVGIKDIAIAKRNEYLKLDDEFQQLKVSLQPKIELAEKEIKNIDSNLAKQQQVYANNFNDGFLTQIEALNNLIKQNSALQTRYYLLVAILLLIELMPVIAKSLLPSGTYDDKVMLRETLEKEMANNNILREKELKEIYNTSALQNDKETITAFFTLTKSDRDDTIKSFSKNWKEQQHQSFDGLWRKMKRDLLTKLEN